MTGPVAREGEAPATSATSATKPVLLCTNDDGVHSAGLEVLECVAERLGDRWTVVPDRQQSTCSHALTLHRPLRVRSSGSQRFAVDGTPADCVLLALDKILEAPPRMVLSGVNLGENIGLDVLYSGTVAAAMEGAIQGIPSMAFSSTGRDHSHLHTYDGVIGRLIEACLARTDLPKDALLNVNLPSRPANEIGGIEITSLGRGVYEDSVHQGADPHGQRYFWIGGGKRRWRKENDADYRAVTAGFVSVTPLRLDMTHRDRLGTMRSWLPET